MRELDLSVEKPYGKRIWVLFAVGLPFFLAAIFFGLLLTEIHWGYFWASILIAEPVFRAGYVSTFNRLCFKFKSFPRWVFVRRMVVYELLLTAIWYGAFKLVYAFHSA